MPAFWTCSDEGHGAFPRKGIEEIQTACAWARRPMDRLVCPVCAANGKPGWVKPATSEEAAKAA